jgi:hypothetical protein
VHSARSPVLGSSRQPHLVENPFEDASTIDRARVVPAGPSRTSASEATGSYGMLHGARTMPIRTALMGVALWHPVLAAALDLAAVVWVDLDRRGRPRLTTTPATVARDKDLRPLLALGVDA